MRIPSRRSVRGWSELRSRSGTTDLWVVPRWDGKPEFGPWTTDDGRRIVDVIASGRGDTLPFAVEFEQSADSTGARRGDVLWAGGLPIGIVSRRFIDELTTLGVSGWSTYEVSITDPTGEQIEGYCGFVADVTGRSEVVSRAWKTGRQMPVYLTTNRVADALLAAGVDGLDRAGASQQLPPRRPKG